MHTAAEAGEYALPQTAPAGPRVCALVGGWGMGGGGVMPLLALGYVVPARAGDTSTAAEAGGYALSSDRGEDFFFFLDFWAFFILFRFFIIHNNTYII